MRDESYLQWFMVIFGALIILAGVPWLLFVQRRGYEPKTTSQMPPLALYVKRRRNPRMRRNCDAR